jgi:hypothetical protein
MTLLSSLPFETCEANYLAKSLKQRIHLALTVNEYRFTPQQ